MPLTRRQVCLSALAGGAASLTTETAVAREYGLVEPRTCLAGDWGEPQPEWRLQLAVFASDDAERRADAYRDTLGRRGVRAEAYIAMWLVEGDNWDRLAVVSARVFDDVASARRAAHALRSRQVPAFARHFTRYVKRR